MYNGLKKKKINYIMSRFDRRLKGVNNKNTSSGGSGAACVPQPIPNRAPLLSGMMFGGNRMGVVNSVQNLQNNSNVSTSLQEKTLDTLVNQVSSSKATTNEVKISNNTIEMLNRRLSRLENANKITAKTNKIYESLEKRLSALEKMYSENMENMEKYVRNQEDRINLLTADYRKTLETLNKIIRDVNTKILELDDTTVKKQPKEKKLEEVKLEEPAKAEIIEVRKKPVIKKEETNEEVIAEVTEEIISKVENKKQVKDKNVSLIIVEKEVSNEN